MADLSAAVDNLKDGVTDAGKRVAAVLPLWVIIIIVVVGTGLLALLVGLCCLCACRRRRGRKLVGGDAASGFPDIHRHLATALPSDGGSRSSEEGAGGRHKLRKRPPSSSSSCSSFGNDGDGGVVVDDRGVEVEEVEEGRGRGEPEFRNMASVPARKASLLAIPPMLTGALRASIVSIGGGRRSAGRGGSGGLNISNDEAANQGSNWHGRRTSEAWIDDDALHGPEVSPTKRSSAAARRKSRLKSWRASIRDSWPLKTPSPTLPHLPHFGGHDGRQAGGAGAGHESVALFQYQKNYGGTDGDRLVPNLPPPLSAAARQREGQLSPPRQLPKPPSQALLAANASTAGLRPVSNFYAAGPGVSNSPRSRGLSYYKYEDTDQPVKSSGSPRSKTARGVGVGTGVVGPRGRQPSADSTMSQILKDTEKRLQDGMVTGVATRNRSGSSPSKRTPGLGLGPDAVTVAIVRSRSRTPSPTKPSRMPHGAVSSSHVRQGSQASFASEPDSLVGDDTPSLPYHGLTSPSRSKPSQQLSPHRRRTSLAPSFASSASSLSTIPSETEDGPLTPNTTAPNSSIPFGMNQMAGLGDPFMPSKTSTPASKKAQGSASRGAQDSGNRSHKRDQTSHARSDSPLSPVTGNMRSPDTTPTRGGTRNAAAQGADKAPNPESQPNRALVFHVPASTPEDERSGNSHKRKPSDDPGAATTPRLSLVIPGNPLLKRLSDLAPPSRSRDQTPEVAHAHPSPALSNNARLSSVYDFYADLTEPSNINITNNNNNTNRRRAGGEVRMVSSSANSVSSSLYSDTGAAERERERQNAALSRISMLLNRDVMAAPSRPKPTVRVVSRDYYHPHGSNDGSNNNDARVSATVAELRRMNSQVSTYSTAAASMYSDGSSAANNTLAAARPESVVPPRRGAAARNYHALASPIKSSPDREVRGRDEVGDLTPTRNRRGLERNGSVEERGGGGSGSGSGSEDGVSLYDQDGFYITPGRAAGVRY